MLKVTNTETWVICDKCSFTEFAGFNATPAEVASLMRWGWMLGAKCTCPNCKGVDK